MYREYIDVNKKARELDLEHKFLLLAVEAVLPFLNDLDSVRDGIYSMVFIKYHTMSLASFRQKREELESLNKRFKPIMKKLFEPYDTSALSEIHKSQLNFFSWGEEIKNYHVASLIHTNEVFENYKERFNGMSIIDFVLQHFEYELKHLSKKIDINIVTDN